MSITTPESGKRFHWATKSCVEAGSNGLSRSMWEVACDTCSLRERFADPNWEMADRLAESHRGWFDEVTPANLEHVRTTHARRRRAATLALGARS